MPERRREGGSPVILARSFFGDTFELFVEKLFVILPPWNLYFITLHARVAPHFPDSHEMPSRLMLVVIPTPCLIRSHRIGVYALLFRGFVPVVQIFNIQRVPFVPRFPLSAIVHQLISYRFIRLSLTFAILSWRVRIV